MTTDTRSTRNRIHYKGYVLRLGTGIAEATPAQLESSQPSTLPPATHHGYSPEDFGLCQDDPLWAVAATLPEEKLDALARAVDPCITRLTELTSEGYRIEQGFFFEVTPGHTGRLLVGALLFD